MYNARDSVQDGGLLIELNNIGSPRPDEMLHRRRYRWGQRGPGHRWQHRRPEHGRPRGGRLHWPSRHGFEPVLECYRHSDPSTRTLELHWRRSHHNRVGIAITICTETNIDRWATVQVYRISVTGGDETIVAIAMTCDCIGSCDWEIVIYSVDDVVSGADGAWGDAGVMLIKAAAGLLLDIFIW